VAVYVHSGMWSSAREEVAAKGQWGRVHTARQGVKPFSDIGPIARTEWGANSEGDLTGEGSKSPVRELGGSL
jgi:hypothetical protein